jgi:hypothetical protein
VARNYGSCLLAMTNASIFGPEQPSAVPVSNWYTTRGISRVIMEALMSLALQLQFSSEVSTASVGLVSLPPERPCKNTVDRDGPLSELDSDAADFLDRPADQDDVSGETTVVFFWAMARYWPDDG